MSDNNPVVEVVGTIIIGAAYVIAANYVGGKLVTASKKIRPALHIPKFSKVKPA